MNLTALEIGLIAGLGVLVGIVVMVIQYERVMERAS